MNIQKSNTATMHSVYRSFIARKVIAWLLIVLQLSFPLINIPFAAATQPNSVLPESDVLTSTATALAGNNSQNLQQQVQSGLINRATSEASSSAEQWLQRFGTARVQLNVDQNGNWDQSSFDLLAPLYDNKKALFFTQVGLRAPDSRVTGNMGFGVRTFYTENWMFGSNFFFDDDFTGKNRRIGIGAEAWTNYLKLSANTYVGTSSWQDSRDFDDYEEKPADGFDIRAEGYLPAQPQFGAKVMYEQYYGDEVALFDTDHLQSNPSAVTLGINYTPIPLITLGTDYRRGQDDMDDLKFQLDLHYDFGHDWRYQISPENVALQRSLAGSRYDLVERNNQIVMQYRKKERAGVGKLVLQTLTDYSAADGVSQNRLQVQVLNTKNEVMPDTTVQWLATGQARLDATSSVTDANGFATVNITNTVNEVTDVTATSGGVSAYTQSHFTAVTPASLALSIDKNGSAANGTATDDATVKVEDSNHHPIAGAAVSWSVASPATLRDSDAKTDASGVAHAHIVSTTAGSAVLTVTSGTLSQQDTVTFVADSQQAVITRFDVTVNNSPANGSSADSAIIEVRDPSNNPVGDTPVTISTDSTTLVFNPGAKRTSSTFHTDAQGQVHLQFTDTVAETVQLTATLGNGNSKGASAAFIADEASASLQRLKVTKNGSPADGHTPNTAEVYVLDATGNPLVNQQVSWKVDKTDIQLSPNGNTDQNGKATISYTSTKAQTFTLTASLANGSTLSAASSFVTDENSIQIADYEVSGGAIANGKATNTATVTVTDAQHNPAVNETVQWSTDGSAILSSQTGYTDAQGQLSVTFSDIKAETVNVTVTLPVNSASQTKPSLFVADRASATIQSLSATKNALANGVATNSALVKVVDANNNPLTHTAVHWRVTGNAQLKDDRSETDANGEATITFTDTVSQVVTLTASLDNGQEKSTDSLFIADRSSARVTLSLVNDASLADGAAEDKINAIVTDAQGNPLPAQVITWSSNSSTAQMPASSKTDLQGHAQIAVKNTVGETVTITATLANQTSTTIDASFISYRVRQLTTDITKQHADGHSVITFTAMLTDNNDKPVVGEAVAFTTTGSAVLSSQEATTDVGGQARVTLTDSKEEDVTVTAKSKAFATDTGKTSTVSFITDRFTGITTNGHIFGMSEHFPTIGILRANFTMEINGTSANNADYAWSSDASWAHISSPGVITLTSTPTSRTATITATPVSGYGEPLTYTFTLNHWVFNIAAASADPTVADSDCASRNGTVPSYTLFSNGAPGRTATRGIGTFYGEWGDPEKLLGSFWSTASSAESMWASEMGSNGTRIFVQWRTGYVNDRVPTQEMDEVCQAF